MQCIYSVANFARELYIQVLVVFLKRLPLLIMCWANRPSLNYKTGCKDLLYVVKSHYKRYQKCLENWTLANTFIFTSCQWVSLAGYLPDTLPLLQWVWFLLRNDGYNKKSLLFVLYHWMVAAVGYMNLPLHKRIG